MRELAKELVGIEQKLGHTHSDLEYAVLLIELVKEERGKAIKERSSPPPEHSQTGELRISPVKGESSTPDDGLQLGRAVDGGSKPGIGRTNAKLPKLTPLVEPAEAMESEVEQEHATAASQPPPGPPGQTATPRKISGHVKDRVDLFEAKTPSPKARAPRPRPRTPSPGSRVLNSSSSTPSPPEMCCHADVHQVPFEGLTLPDLSAAREADDDEWFPPPGSWRDV